MTITPNLPATVHPSAAAGAPVTYSAVDMAMSEATAERIAAAVAPNTQRAYARQWAAFAAWCSAAGRVALPSTAETAAEYVTTLADSAAASPSNIEQALAAIRTVHRTAGHEGLPDYRAARLVLRGHRKHRAESGARTRQAPPVTVEALRRMLAGCDPATLRGLRDRVVLLLGVTMFARRSELVALDLSEVTETADGLIIYVRASKTDRDAQGAETVIPYGQHRDTCPVRTVRTWIETLAAHGVTTGRLLRSVNRHGRLGAALTSKSANEIVRAAAVAAKLPDADRYTAHSLRAGGATIAATAGHPVAAIARHGRWSPTSPVVHGYIRAVDKWRDNPLVGTGL